LWHESAARSTEFDGGAATTMTRTQHRIHANRPR